MLHPRGGLCKFDLPRGGAPRSQPKVRKVSFPFVGALFFCLEADLLAAGIVSSWDTGADLYSCPKLNVEWGLKAGAEVTR